MKTRFHRILSVVMAFCLLLSVVPMPTMAAENDAVPTNAATNGSYVNGVWTEGGNGSVTHNINGTDVTLSKTATPVDGMENTFDVTLKVQTSTTTTIYTASGAVVLVFDVSGSMDYCAECRNESRHQSTCPLNKPTEFFGIPIWNSEVKASETRIAAARSAGAAFLKAYAGNDASANRRLSIVTFASNYSVKMDWVNVAGGAGNNSYDAAYNAIMGLSANGGTNLEGGLQTALNQLGAVAGYDSTNVVLLTDGAPTYYIGGGSGSEGSATCNSKAAAQATAIKGTGAKLYTIGFGVANDSTYSGGPTVSAFLRDSIASAGSAYNAENSAELHAAFAVITESITDGLDGLGWTATDPMADMITVIGGTGENFFGSDGNYTWKLANAEVVTNGNVTTYSYTYTYRVTLDVQGQNFEEGKFFPVNGETYLNVNGQKYAFPVPGVTGVLPRTDVSVTKVWEDKDNQDGIRAKEVTVQLKDAAGNAVGEPVVLNAANNWTYTWDGETYNLIEKVKGEFVVYTVQELNVPNGYTPVYTTGESNFELVVTNVHEVEKKDITVSKVWDDKDNQDGIRPESVSVNLLADGVVVDTAELNAANGWSYTFPGYEVYKAGSKIVYTVEETNVPEGYTASVDGFTVTNSHETAKTSVEVTKVWNDANNQDGIRPNDVTVILVANGEATNVTLTLNQGNGWTGAFENVDKFANGEEIVYTVSEVKVEGYETAITGDQANGYTITNSYTPATISISGAKTWNDANNQDGKRPASITINLLKNGEVVASKTVTAADGWAWTFTNLAKYENQGTLVTYTITENEVAGYTTVIDGYNVTNTYAPEQTSVTVTKSWQDNNDQDGIRPNDITVNLLANGEATGETLVLSSGNSWTGTFTDLDKYAEGVEIVYTVEEVKVEGYESVITGDQANGYIITNTHAPATVSVSGSKTWVDNNDQDGARPESITINLKADGEVIDTITVTEADNWTWTFNNLPKYKNGGVEIVYAITENAVEDYSTEYNGYNVTNTHTPAQTSVTVTKAWADNDDQDGIRPNHVTVVLMADGQETEYTLTLNEANNWTGSFAELDKYANGQVIVYTVKEISVEGYNTVITGDQATGYTITNSHTPAVVEVSGSKTWNDNNNQDGARPESITIHLMKDGQVIETKTVTEADGWAWTFTNLAKYEDHGTLITYAITEDAVEDYTSEVNGYNVTNTHAPEKTSVMVTKAWVDNDDQDGIRPNDVTVVLMANGEETEYTLVLNQGNHWSDSFTNLDKYQDGVEVVYTVKEVEVNGYTSVISGNQVTGYTVTNSHNPETMSVSGAKTWVDNDNQDGVRPESITINLLANGEIIDSVVVTEAEGWAWTFENLPVFENHGSEIVYSITENAVEDYSAEYDGFNVTNTHTPEQTSVTVSKAWYDNNDQDGIRPEEINVVLLANGEETGKTLVLDAEGNWTGSFTELDKFADGEVIVYTVSEIVVDGYETVITGDQVTGYTITNSHLPETLAVEGAKTWDDNNNQDGARPESITINLLKNGEVIDSVEVTEADGWTWSFINLPKYENGGVEIVYAITENAVEGYSTTYDGYNVTNSYTPAEISITVTKAWADDNDADGLRPEDITIVLYANGEETKQTLVLTADENWTGSFVGLPKYEGGVEIVYTINEVSVKGYNTVIRGDAASGFVVTNSRTVIPQTGDERNPMIWVGAMVMSAAVVMFLALESKKRRNVR